MNFKKLISVIILLIISYDCIAQNKAIVDSLILRLNDLKSDTAKAHVYSDLCWEYRNSDIKLAYNYGSRALALYTAQNDILGQCQILNRLGIVKRNTSEYAIALDCFFKILSIAELPTCNSEVAYANNNICDIYTLLEKYDKALEYAEKAYPIFQAENNKLGIAYNLNLKGIVYKNLKLWNKALSNFTQSINIRKKIGHQSGVASSLGHIGDCYMELNQYDSAFICYNKSLELNEQAGSQTGIGFCYLGLGKYYAANKDYKPAIEYLNKVIEIAQRNNNLYYIQKPAEVLQEVYYQIHDYKNAYKYQTLASTTKDSLQKYDYAKQMTTLEINLTTEQQNKLKEIEEIRKNAIYESRIYKQKLMSFSLILGLIAIMIVAFAIYRNYKYVRKTNQLLKENNEEITSQKEAILKQNEQLQELNATKDKFFSIIAHDLKNPFNVILGFSDLIVTSNILFGPEEMKRFVLSIQKAAKSAYELLENLLEWSRSQTGRIEFAPEVIKLDELITDTISITWSNSQVKNIQVSYEPDETIVIYADRNMINTVLRNLVTNAIKYTHKSGMVKIAATKNGDNVQISVMDNGVGISPEVIEKLFLVSEKTSTPGTEDEKGTGLGLLLCKEFVEKHGGKIWVESELEKGSEFKFTLPVSN